MHESDILLELFSTFRDNSPIKSELPKEIKEGDLENLIMKGIIKKDYDPPLHCKVDGCDESAETREENGKLVVKCNVHPGHITEISKDDYTVYRIDLGAGLKIILENLIDGLDDTSQETYGDYCKLKANINDTPITFIFCMEEFFTEERLFNIFSPHISKKDFIVLIHKPTSTNFENLDSILRKIPLGSVIFNIPLDKIKEKKVNAQFQKWVSYTSEISSIENTILEKIEDEDLRNLTVSVDTNPKYILSGLSRIKLSKSCGIHTTKSWEDTENFISLIFYYLYTTDIKYGGGKQKGKGVPDNVFLTENDDSGMIAGIVDSKCSFVADLSSEKTEKYENYLKLVRQLRWPIQKKAMIFVVFGTKSNYTTNEFFKRIKKKLEQGEYLVILPIDTLELLLYSYLGIILRGKINMNKSNFNDLLNKLFDNDFLDGIGNCAIENGLYTIPVETLLEELKKRAEEPSSIETAYKELFENS